MPPTKLGIVPGSLITVEQAVLALVTKSANDAAAALGEMLGGDEDRFAQMMTLRAHALGMAQTTFRNASGLPDWDQVSTARDMAILARHLIQDFPSYYHYFSTPSFVYAGRFIPSHQRLLTSYPGADGLKTGFTDAAGYNVVTSAVHSDTRLIGVVLGAANGGERDAHMAMLLDQGFDRMGVPTVAASPYMVSRRRVRQPPAGADQHGPRSAAATTRRRPPPVPTSRDRAGEHPGRAPAAMDPFRTSADLRQPCPASSVAAHFRPDPSVLPKRPDPNRARPRLRPISWLTPSSADGRGHLTVENAVGCSIEFTILATIGPFDSVAARFSIHSGSAWNAVHFASRSAKLSHASKYVRSWFDSPTRVVQKPAARIPCRSQIANVVVSNRLSRSGNRPGTHR